MIPATIVDSRTRAYYQPIYRPSATGRVIDHWVFGVENVAGSTRVASLAEARAGAMSISDAILGATGGQPLPGMLSGATAQPIRLALNTGVFAPPLPHPDASNLALGPNIGGADGVILPGDMPGGGTSAMPGGTGSGSGGLLLLVGGALILVLLLKKK